jgi:hypothetical protein
MTEQSSKGTALITTKVTSGTSADYIALARLARVMTSQAVMTNYP